MYEEKIVNGVLCHRTTPDGEWDQFSAESLTTAYIAMKGVADERGRRADELSDMVLAAINLLSV